MGVYLLKGQNIFDRHMYHDNQEYVTRERVQTHLAWAGQFRLGITMVAKLSLYSFDHLRERSFKLGSGSRRCSFKPGRL
jgi:hypothetical protein